jgi:hypothetical protein
MAEYPTHERLSDDHLKIDGWYPECARCGSDLSDGSYGDYWLDEKEAAKPCVIVGNYSTDGKVLLRTNAETDWLRDHWGELKVEFGVDHE